MRRAQKLSQSLLVLSTKHKVLMNLSRAQGLKIHLQSAKGKQKLKAQRGNAQSAGGDQATRLGLQKVSHKGAKESEVSEGFGSWSQKGELMYIDDLGFFVKHALEVPYS